MTIDWADHYQSLLFEERAELANVRLVMRGATDEAVAFGMIPGVESLREWLGGYLPTINAKLTASESAHAETKARLDRLYAEHRDLLMQIENASADTPDVTQAIVLMKERQAHAETRRELEAISLSLASSKAAHCDEVRRSESSVAREAETWRMVDALIAALPKCTRLVGADDTLVECDRPATRAFERGGARYCDECAAAKAATFGSVPPDYPRAAPLRALASHLRRAHETTRGGLAQQRALLELESNRLEASEAALAETNACIDELFASCFGGPMGPPETRLERLRVAVSALCEKVGRYRSNEAGWKRAEAAAQDAEAQAWDLSDALMRACMGMQASFTLPVGWHQVENAMMAIDTARANRGAAPEGHRRWLRRWDALRTDCAERISALRALGKTGEADERHHVLFKMDQLEAGE